MPLMTLLLLQAALGGWCAYRTRHWLELRSEFVGLPLVPPLAHACVLSAPAGVYALRFHPAWFLHYLTDPSGSSLFDTVSFGASLGLLVTLCLVTLGGFAAVRYAVMRVLAPYCSAPAVGFAVTGVVLFLGFWRRSLHVGTPEQLKAGEAEVLWTHPVGALALVLVLGGLLTGWLCARVFRDDKSVAPRTSSPSLPPVM